MKIIYLQQFCAVQVNERNKAELGVNELYPKIGVSRKLNIPK